MRLIVGSNRLPFTFVRDRAGEWSIGPDRCGKVTPIQITPPKDGMNLVCKEHCATAIARDLADLPRREEYIPKASLR